MKRESEIKSLKLQNNEYVVTVFYYGDYERDFKSGKCDMTNITLSCKPKGEAFPLTLMAGHIIMTIPYSPVLSIDEIDNFQEQINVTKESAKELEKNCKTIFSNVKMSGSHQNGGSHF